MAEISRTAEDDASPNREEISPRFREEKTAVLEISATQSMNDLQGSQISALGKSTSDTSSAEVHDASPNREEISPNREEKTAPEISAPQSVNDLQGSQISAPWIKVSQIHREGQIPSVEVHLIFLQ